MNWSDERYVRLYTRDTVTWKSWSFETRAIFCLLLRKVDRSGVLDTKKTSKVDAISLICEAPKEVCEKALNELLSSESVVKTEFSLVFVNFLAAQEARQNDALRQRESRERRRSDAVSTGNNSTRVTRRHTVSHGVTRRHTVSQDVTPAVPIQPSITALSESADGRSEIEKLKKAWNEIVPKSGRPFSKWLAGREKEALAALARRSLDEWRAVFEKIPQSNFLSGNVPPKDGRSPWVADIDFALRPEKNGEPESAVKILEGKYDNRPDLKPVFISEEDKPSRRM